MRRGQSHKILIDLLANSSQTCSAFNLAAEFLMFLPGGQLASNACLRKFSAYLALTGQVAPCQRLWPRATTFQHHCWIRRAPVWTPEETAASTRFSYNLARQQTYQISLRRTSNSTLLTRMSDVTGEAAPVVGIFCALSRLTPKLAGHTGAIFHQYGA